ncbi:MAG TPA: DUF2905 domain-containing protein [Thermoanaerobaculaceae bacterium]|nr:DUF2905 domain-containing protein [Thermoanaerobaculaceae bacterium]
MNGRDPGLFLVMLGVVLVLTGLLLWSGWLSWFGRLPGDIRWESDHTRVYVPITSMLLVSLVLSLLVWLFQKLR